MKIFLPLSAILALTSGAPQLGGHIGGLRGGVVGGLGIGVVGVRAGGQTSHQTVSKPLQGELRTTAQSKPLGALVSSASSSDSVSDTAQGGLRPSFLTGGGIGGGHSLAVGGAGRGLVGAGLVGAGHGLVGGARLVGAAPVISRPAVIARPAVVAGRGIVGGIGGGVVGHGGLVGGIGRGIVGGIGHGVVGHGVVGHGVVAHGVAEVYPDEISPYTYQYNVADDYSGSNFQATESDDGTSNREGSYTVALPDGRIQHVNYHTNDVDGYIAEVTYDGTAAYPEVVRGVAGVRPVVGGVGVVARPVGVVGGVVGGHAGVIG